MGDCYVKYSHQNKSSILALKSGIDYHFSLLLSVWSEFIIRGKNIDSPGSCSVLLMKVMETMMPVKIAFCYWKESVSSTGEKYTNSA